jgi:hypothetical protein
MAQASNIAFRLIYASRISPASETALESTLEDILADAIPRNRDLGVTGLLLAYRGWFIHLIEGEEAAVRQAFRMICADRRHRAPRIVIEDAAAARLCAEWSLAAWALSKDDAAVLRGFDAADRFDPAVVPHRLLLRLLAVAAKAHRERLTAQQHMTFGR